jgi:multiple sugar transport system substrate-binding protein
MEKIMKKRMSLLLLWVLGIFLAVPVSLFAGSVRDTAAVSRKSVRLRCWSFFSGTGGEIFDAMVAKFNHTHRGIKIISETKPYSDYFSALSSAAAAGTAPDVAVIQQGSLSRYIRNGALCALDDMSAPFDAPLDDFIKNPLEACRYAGKLYALPLDVYPLVMYYNTDLFSQAGVVKVPETYAELIQAARTIHNRTGAIGLAVDNVSSGFKAWNLARFFISLLKQQGTDVLTGDNTRANFNNTAGEKALSVIIDMHQVSPVVPPSLNYEASVDAFLQGRAGIHINGVWVTNVFEKQKSLKFAAVPLPPLFGRNAAWAGSHILAVPVRQSPDPRKAEAALTFILWMTEHSELWARTGYIPARKSVVRKAEYLSLPNRAAYRDAAASAVMAPPAPAWNEIYNAISDNLENALLVNKSVSSILKEMDRKVNEIIAAY